MITMLDLEIRKQNRRAKRKAAQHWSYQHSRTGRKKQKVRVAVVDTGVPLDAPERVTKLKGPPKTPVPLDTFCNDCERHWTTNIPMCKCGSLNVSHIPAAVDANGKRVRRRSMIAKLPGLKVHLQNMGHTRKELEAMGVRALRPLARSVGVKKVKEKRKSDLINAILEKEGLSDSLRAEKEGKK